MLGLIATIQKCPDFPPEMSGILDTRIPTYCNSEFELKLKLELLVWLGKLVC